MCECENTILGKKEKQKRPTLTCSAIFRFTFPSTARSWSSAICFILDSCPTANKSIEITFSGKHIREHCLQWRQLLASHRSKNWNKLKCQQCKWGQLNRWPSHRYPGFKDRVGGYRNQLSHNLVWPGLCKMSTFIRWLVTWCANTNTLQNDINGKCYNQGQVNKTKPKWCLTPSICSWSSVHDCCQQKRTKII